MTQPYEHLHPSARNTVDKLVTALAGCAMTRGERERAVDLMLAEISAQAYQQGARLMNEKGLQALGVSWRAIVDNTAAAVRHHALERLAQCGAGAGRA